jgi:hypothetical protein
LKITATPTTTTVTAQSATAALAIANTLEIDMSSDGTKCIFPAEVLAAPISVAVGTTVNWKNTGANAATVGYVIHVDPTTDKGASNDSGIAHQGEGAPALAPDETGGTSGGTPNPLIWPEKVTAIPASGNVTWHCHAPATQPSPSPAFTIVQPE